MEVNILIFISTVLHCEAEPFIKKFSLKKDRNIKKFQVFKNNEIVVIVSKKGAVNAASACAYAAGKFDMDEYDIFINVGLCVSRNRNLKKGTAVLCNKIMDSDTNSDFYPDMIFKHPFEEGCLESFPGVLDNKKLEKSKGDILDKEGAAFFQSASIFLPAHRIYCLKIVSGYLSSGTLEEREKGSLVGKNIEEICKWMYDVARGCGKPKNVLDERDMDYINEIISNLSLSVSMQEKLKKLARAYKIRNGDLLLALEPFTQICCKTKREGKVYFEKLEQQLNFI